MSEKKREFEVGDVYQEDIAQQPLNSRRDTLESLAYDVKEDGYTKILKDEEVTAKRAELSDVCISIDTIEVEKKEAVDVFKERLKEPNIDKKELLSAIKHKSEFRNGTLYYVDDQENGFMYVFDENAECIESRPIRPTERQAKIRTLNKEAVNG